LEEMIAISSEILKKVLREKKNESIST
jgi:hypothetical protein